MKSSSGAPFNLALGTLAIAFGTFRVTQEDSRVAGLILLAVGALLLISGRYERAAARAAAATRASLTPGEHAVVVRQVGPRRVEVVRALRQATGLELADAKRVVTTPGSTAVDGVDLAVAESVAERLRAAGAEVDVEHRPSAISDEALPSE